MNDPRDVLDLLDWKRRVFELYAHVREVEPRTGWEHWRTKRDALFRTHSQTPLPERERASFRGLDLYDYDPALRVTASLTAAVGEEVRVPSSSGDDMVFTRCATAGFSLLGADHTLDVYWIGGYGGGLFLPFRDATSGKTTYGAGRYLYDTIKGADLGTTENGELVLDFNFAYNPSCAYDPRWSCPLAPAANLLEPAVEAGEKTPSF